MEYKSLKSYNGLKIGMVATVAFFAMVAIVTLTSSFPVWLSVGLSFLTPPLLVVPMFYKSGIKELELKDEIDKVIKYIENAEKEQEREDRLAKISVNPQQIQYGSSNYEYMVEDIENSDQQEDDIITI